MTSAALCGGRKYPGRLTFVVNRTAGGGLTTLVTRWRLRWWQNGRGFATTFATGPYSDSPAGGKTLEAGGGICIQWWQNGKTKVFAIMLHKKFLESL